MTLPLVYHGNERWPFKFDIPVNDLNRIPPRPSREYTANTVATHDDVGRWNHMNLAGANTYTIPPSSTLKFPLETVLAIAQTGAGATTLTPGSGVTFRSQGAANGARTMNGINSCAIARQIALDVWLLKGEFTP